MTKLCECGCGHPTSIAKNSLKRLGHTKGQPVRFIQGHHLKWRGTFLERFEHFFKKDSDKCWVWQGSRTPKGYGQFGISSGNMRPAHRIAWQLYKGPIPKGKFVCHVCDNPPCVNPNHLFVGTNRDNMTDMFKKGRGNRPLGEKHFAAKLTEEDVLNIRKDPRTHKEVAKDYNMGQAQICAIRLRKAWRHI